MYSVLLLVLPLVEKGPDEEDVVAGWTAFGIFGLLILAVVILGFSLTKHLKRADKSAAEGRFDPPTRRPAPPQQP
jgi:hypothetical protein